MEWPGGVEILLSIPICSTKKNDDDKKHPSHTEVSERERKKRTKYSDHLNHSRESSAMNDVSSLV